MQARQALLDLMKIQEKFYQENKRYATRFGEIEKYNLKYHSGIVYLEIESAGKIHTGRFPCLRNRRLHEYSPMTAIKADFMRWKEKKFQNMSWER